MVAMTVAATATPTADPTCRVALYSAVAAPVCSGATVSKAEAWVGMKVCACPKPSSSISATGTTGGMVLLITNARHSSAIATGRLPGGDQPPRPDPPVEPGGDLGADHDPDRLREGQQTRGQRRVAERGLQHQRIDEQPAEEARPPRRR